jgi:hypothetical protein
LQILSDSSKKTKSRTQISLTTPLRTSIGQKR